MGRLIAIGLLAVFAAADGPKTAREQYDALMKEYKAAEAAWEERYGDEKDVVARYREWPAWSFLPRFLALGEASRADPAGIDSLIWVVDQAKSVGTRDAALLPSYSKALKLLGRPDLIADERVVRSIWRGARYVSPASEAYLRLVLEASPNVNTRGLACLGLAKLLDDRRLIAQRPWFDDADKPFTAFLKGRNDPEWVAYIRAADPAAVAAESEALYERTIAEFGVFPFKGDPRIAGVREVPLADLARPALEHLRRIGVGKVAPEIEGEDAEGKSFKLGDYRGKVVVLIFSGNWSGPCRERYPEWRALVARLKDAPFALLSVDTDPERGNLQALIKDGTITWRSWWDGPNRPICEAWGVVGRFPMIYVLDARGVIRHVDPGGKELDEAVDALLKEIR
jgi:peroxiredoxin